MSVYDAHRGESGVRYVDLAWEIYDHTKSSCRRLPKRWDRYGLLSMVDLADKLQRYCVAANSAYPTNQHEAQLRRDCLIKANMALQDLNTMVGHLARDIKKARDLQTRELPEKLTREKTEAMLQKWGELIAEEGEKISAVRKANVRQFKKLPPGPVGMPPAEIEL